MVIPKLLPSQNQEKVSARPAALVGPRPAIPNACQTKACAVIGAAHGDEPAFDDDARHPDVEHRRSEKESEEGDPGHARSVEPQHHEG